MAREPAHRGRLMLRVLVVAALIAGAVWTLVYLFTP